MFLLSLPAPAFAQERRIPETYTGITANMTPAGIELKADILEWSTDAQRQAAVAALTDADDPVAALRALPTLGVVWRSDSAVGAAIKYAERRTGSDGSETVTRVTDKRVDSTSFNPWSADAAEVSTRHPYSVIEFSTGNGTGTLALAAAVRIDTDNARVSLDRSGGAPVLAAVRKAPKPYWADAGD
jgi:hypothetical protein